MKVASRTPSTASRKIGFKFHLDVPLVPPDTFFETCDKAMKNNNDAPVTGAAAGPNLAGDLLWFTAASFGAGIMSAVAAGAVVILLA